MIHEKGQGARLAAEESTHAAARLVDRRWLDAPRPTRLSPAECGLFTIMATAGGRSGALVAAALTSVIHHNQSPDPSAFQLGLSLWVTRRQTGYASVLAIGEAGVSRSLIPRGSFHRPVSARVKVASGVRRQALVVDRALRVVEVVEGVGEGG